MLRQKINNVSWRFLKRRKLSRDWILLYAYYKTHGKKSIKTSRCSSLVIEGAAALCLAHRDKEKFPILGVILVT